MNLLFRRHVLGASLAAAATVMGCASAGPAGSRMNQNAPPVAAAGFTLQGIRVQWQENPGFNARFNYMVPKSTPGAPPPEALKTRSTEQMKEILQFFRAEAVPTLTAALVEQRVAAGSSHRIVLTPMSAFQDNSGWGTRIVVRATVLDADNRAVWHSDIESHSGLQWFGPSVSRPDASYVRNFVSGLVETMRKAGLVGQA